jgi:hypothetical protein
MCLIALHTHHACRLDAVLSCPVLSCPVLSCPVLSCPVLSCPVLSCPVVLPRSVRVALHAHTWALCYRALSLAHPSHPAVSLTLHLVPCSVGVLLAGPVMAIGMLSFDPCVVQIGMAVKNRLHSRCTVMLASALLVGHRVLSQPTLFPRSSPAALVPVDVQCCSMQLWMW